MGEILRSLETSEFPSTGWLKIDPLQYEGVTLQMSGTDFWLLGRKSEGIGLSRLLSALRIAWPMWQSIFTIPIPSITIVDGDLALGGGALEPFAVAIYLSAAEFDRATKDHLDSVLGWEAHPNARAYIERYYSEFEDPIQAYVNNQMIHELGHIYFLNGVTRFVEEEGSGPTDSWFALGMGMVYDRVIWSKISEIPSPKLEAFIKTYKERYSKRSDIDQRLINPDVSRDAAAGLTPALRLQMYGHAKAFVFLNQLRLEIGPEKFDAYVKDYLSRPFGSPVSYEKFLEYFADSDRERVRKVESEHCVR